MRKTHPPTPLIFGAQYLAENKGGSERSIVAPRQLGSTTFSAHEASPKTRGARSGGNLGSIDSRSQEIARFAEEILRSPTEAHARQVLDRSRGIKRPIEFLSQVAHRCRELKRLDASVLVWSKVVELNPGLGTSREHLSRTLLLAQKPAEAAEQLLAWTELEPDAGVAWALLGAAYNTLQRWDDAAAAFERAMELVPDQPEVLTGYAHSLWRLNLPERALEVLNRAQDLNPQNPSVLNDLGVMYLQLGQVENAVRAYEAALKISPDIATIRHNLSLALRAVGRNQDALIHSERAVKLSNGNPGMAANLASILNDLDRFSDAEKVLAGMDVLASPMTVRANATTLRGLKRHDQAIAELRRGLERDPSAGDLWFMLGNLLMEQGRGEEAEHAFDKTIELVPLGGAHHRAKADLHLYREGDEHLARMEAMAKLEDLPNLERMHLDFALGKAYDDVGAYERAFEHFRLGNQAKRAITGYDEPGVDRLIELVKRLLPEPIMPIEAVGDACSSLPVFVVGMPRSGTTLVEQILSRHPSIVGLGEPTFMHTSLDKVIFFSPAGVEYPIADERYRELGEMYVRCVLPEAGSAVRAVDKLPSNFFFLGFIGKSLPNARVIHVRRDPVDTCISLYSKLFTKTQNFSYDLGELGRYYRRYLDITAHWRRVMPAGSLLEIEYEALVKSPEETVQAMLSFIGLPWDEACLQPSRKPGVVMTASAVQVRRPIYQTSVGRREGYLPYLGELIEGLGAGG